ncbi:aromatic ring-hydroxylating dioxygenase subunit alpha [Polyangium sp. 15x6]|uniref:aromatic ring-hydroxylating oxygenase subunit alpha n=1 Tax=Polyangium sp. 15x6 TaxID=3042687 RepID=UPI00249A9F51|nr:aromatic ring-hydroxylating dioxygenase subunit alpha [Polyangium sp. 15x6]MDI3285183.1 aromatic ring-hydroxylating dioxygenase subunit alpha [Polyangium sp. 15x6]
MRQETQIELICRALDNIDRRRSDADGEPFELPVERYLDPSIFERERALLRSRPVVVGFASQVASPGDFITHDHAGVPLVVTHDHDGVLRAFVNVCRHRGARIADACGHAQRLVCPYHGWSYNLSGRLEGVPHRQEFAGVDLEQRGLIELPVWRRFGLVFACLTPGPATRAFPFAEDLEELDSHVLHAPSERTRRMNWKLMMDGSWETYHFRVTHAKTIASHFFDNTGVFDFVEPDIRMVLPKRSIVDLRHEDPATYRIRQHANLLYGLFPNTIVLVQPDHAMVVTMWPTSIDRTTIVAGMLIPEPPQTEKARAHWQKNEAIFWNAIEEDIAMGERIQSTLSSGVNRSFLFGRCEHLIGKFHRVLEEAITDATSRKTVSRE